MAPSAKSTGNSPPTTHASNLKTLPINSGLKRCYGHRWDRPNATAVAALDTLDRNGQWRQVWPKASYAAT